MGSHARGVPKAMLRVGGVPIIERQLSMLAESEFRRVTVITGWNAEPLEAYLDDLSATSLDIELRVHRESEPRGNIGSLRDVASDGERVLFLFADLVTDLDFSRLLAVHLDRGMEVTLAAHWDAHRLQFGELVVEGSQVARYCEKPTKRFRVCSGVAIFEPPVLDLLAGRHVPTGISDLVTDAIGSGFGVTYWDHDARWVDVNRPADVALAERAMLERDA
jgi:NDP-sugar pyrophosphorylase family protein